MNSFLIRQRILMALWMRQTPNLFWGIAFPLGWFLVMAIVFTGPHNRAETSWYLHSAATVVAGLSGTLSVAVRIALNKEMKLFRRFALLPGGGRTLAVHDAICAILYGTATWAVLAALTLSMGGGSFGAVAAAAPAVLLGMASFAAVGVWIGGISRSVGAASGMGSALLFAGLFASGLFFPLPSSASWLEVVSWLLPSSHLHAIVHPTAGADPRWHWVGLVVIGVAAVLAVRTTFKEQ